MKGLQDSGVDIELCLVGAKAGGFFASVGGNVTATVRDLGEEPSLGDLIGGVKSMLDAYTEGRIDALYLAGNEFVNTMTQSPAVEQLLRTYFDDSLESAVSALLRFRKQDLSEEYLQRLKDIIDRYKIEEE